MPQVKQRPRWRLESWTQHFFVERIVRRAGPSLRHIHVQFEFVDMRNAVHVVHIIVKQLRRRICRENCLQPRRVPHGHLQGCETSPRDAEHAHISVRPLLVCPPRDHLLSIHLLLLGIFPLRRRAFTRAKPANVHPHAHIPTPRKISMLRVIASRRAIIFAIRQIFQQGWELLSVLCPVRHVKRCRQPNPIFHWNPRLLHANAVAGWGRRLAGESARRGREKESKRSEKENPNDPATRRSDQANLLKSFVGNERITLASTLVPAASPADRSPTAPPSYKDGCVPAPTTSPPDSRWNGCVSTPPG